MLLVLVLALAVGGCGSDEETSGTATTGGTTEAATTGETSGNAIRVGLVTDIGGLDDRSFNFLANKGLQRAESELGVEGRVVVSKSEADYVPNLTTLAKQDYDLVVAVGFLMANALEKVASRYRDVDFAIIDYSQGDIPSKPKNVRGLLFKEQEAGYLVGFLAGLLTKAEAGSKQVIGSVGGQKIPPVDRYIAGYRAGAKKANPQINTLNGYSQDFVDQAKCKEIALDQMSQGAHVVFQVAGQCGLGALSAAKEKNMWGIGVDADQPHPWSHPATKTLKKVDVAVFQTIQQVQDGSFNGGEDTVFDIASGGVGIGKIAPSVPADVVAQVKRVQDEIAAGKVADIPDTVKG
jgi:basic membrane protein A and related proteins